MLVDVSADPPPLPERLLEDMAWLRSLAGGLVLDSGAAEDLVQETWLSALRKRPSSLHARPWLRAVLRNAWRQELRSSARRAAREERAAKEEAVPSPEELSLRVERQRLLAEALQRLDEPYRSTVMLRYAEGLQPAEIARRQGLPGGTVRRRLSEGLERLRRDLDRRYADRRDWVRAFLPWVGLEAADTAALSLPALVLGVWSMKQTVIALVVLVLLAGGLYVVLDDGAGPEGAQGLSTQAPEETAGGEAATAVVRASAGQDARSAVAPGAAVGAPEAIRLVGRVVVLGDCGIEDGLEVFALDDPRDATRMARLLDASGWDDKYREEFERELIARAPVAADGSFELSLPAERDTVHLQLRGPRLLLSQAQEVALPQVGDLVLQAELGTWVRGRVELPAETEVEPSDLVIRLTASAMDPSPASTLVGGAYWTVVQPQSDGRFEVYGVPAERELELLAVPETLAGVRESCGTSEACGQLDVRLSFTTGGRVRGIVHDEDGQPIPGAQVEAYMIGRWFGFDDLRARTAESDEEGRFELAALPLGKLRLQASKAGMLESRKVETEISSTGYPPDVVLELERGRTLEGRVLWPDGNSAESVALRATFDRAYFTGAAILGAARGASGEGVSDADGHYAITGLGPGPFTLRAEVPVEEEVEPLVARRDNLRPKGVVDDLVLHPPLELSGRVLDARRRPLAAFEIEVRRVVKGALGETVLEERRESFADSAGRFSFAGIDEGTWELSARGAGCLSHQPKRVDLEREHLDVGDLVLDPAASVSGIVTAASGLPIAGARVRVNTQEAEWKDRLTPGRKLPRASSGTDGRFLLEGLPAEALELVAEHELHAPGTSGVLDLEATTVVEGLVLVLGAGGELTGEVWLTSGDPGDGRIISLERLDAASDELMTRSDEEGRFLFENVDPGRWRVTAVDVDEMVSTGSIGGDAVLMTEVEIVAGETQHVVLGSAPRHPVEVSGRVMRGREPHAGAWISFSPTGSITFEQLAVGRIGEDGRYALTVDGSGEYSVTVQMDLSDPEGTNTIDFVREVPASPRATIDLELPLGSLSGQVFDAEGEPAAGCRVTLMSDGRGGAEEYSQGTYLETRAESDGRFTVTNLRAGTYQLAAGGSSFDGGPAWARIWKTDISLDEGEERAGIEFHLPPSVSVQVTVSDEGGNPLEGLSVFARDSGGRIVDAISIAISGENGACTLSGLAPGMYSFSARGAGRVSSETSAVEVSDRSDARIELTATVGTKLRVRLLDSEGAPVRGWVEIYDEHDREVGGLYPGHELEDYWLEGAFAPSAPVVGPLARGTYRVEAQAFGRELVTKEVEIEGEGEESVEIVFP